MFGQRLKLARKKAGLSLRDLAKKISPPISAQAISKYEAGLMMPSSIVLVKIAKTLGVSLDFLMSEQVAQLVGLEFRKHSSTSAKDRAIAEALVIEKLEDYFSIEEVLGLQLEVNAFGTLSCNQVESLEQVEKKANDLREYWKLGNDPIPSMTGLLEHKGIRVIEADLPDRFDGLTCEVKRSGNKSNTEVVVISSQTNIERRRFNLAHELAHRVIYETSNPDLNLEKAMNRFAAAFLIPADHLCVDVGKKRQRISYPELKQLKHYYGVSAAAMLIRLRDVGILSSEVVNYQFRTSANHWRKNEPDPIMDEHGLGAFEKPQHFNLLVYRALAEQMISPVRAAQLLKCPLAEVEQEIHGRYQP
jgi:Zn-dependent peptidase ImmA (M78 family)/DNA-binding XRE family transcriptional regulator